MQQWEFSFFELCTYKLIRKEKRRKLTVQKKKINKMAFKYVNIFAPEFHYEFFQKYSKIDEILVNTYMTSTYYILLVIFCLLCHTLI